MLIPSFMLPDYPSRWSVSAIVFERKREQEKSPEVGTHFTQANKCSSDTQITGLYRVHQFSKVEMFCITSPSTSDQMLEELVGNPIQWDIALALVERSHFYRN